MKPTYNSNPGTADIIRQGHTTDGTQGSDPQASEVPASPVRDLTVNRSRG